MKKNPTLETSLCTNDLWEDLYRALPRELSRRFPSRVFLVHT